MVNPVTHRQVTNAIGRLRRASTGEEGSRRRAAGSGGTGPTAWGNLPMVMWPALTLIGFVLLTAFVVAMGMQSTARYEREQRSMPAHGSRQTAGEPVGAASA